MSFPSDPATSSMQSVEPVKPEPIKPEAFGPESFGPTPDVTMPHPAPRAPEQASGSNPWRVPTLLFVLTCLSTATSPSGPVYGVAVMIILLSHEFGHYLQARRHNVPASLPYFLPLPFFSPFGTLGAVIKMRPHIATGKALYDIAITGPLAGLVPTILFAFIGIRQSSFVPTAELPSGPSLLFGEPLLFKWISLALLGPAPADHTMIASPLAFAAWVGIFITALNLMPIGQLDGGHILYVLAPKLAHRISTLLFAAGAVSVLAFGYWHWTLLLIMLALVGLRHPPVRDLPPFPLGWPRRLLGWCVLLFIFIGLTPSPISLTGT